MKISKAHITAAICLAVALVITTISGLNFLSLYDLGDIYPSESLREVKMLSEYFDGVKNTAMDTEIYIFEGEKPGGKILVLGGTHGNEPSGYLSAITMIENIKVEEGTVFVVPYTNRSGMTHNDPQEGSPQFLHITTTSGVRSFRYGSRASNPVHQWPDPDVYVHASSGQQLSGSETRNINRAYPGKADGTLTEKAAYGIAELVRQEDINLTFDLHEASPEYPVINATVSHEKGMSIAAEGVMDLQMSGISMTLEPSPVNLHGLTHRELGDYTNTIPLLMETANASQGRLRGATNEALALTGKDKAYVKSQALGFLYVPYTEEGHPIESRVGRHLESINIYTNIYSQHYPELPVVFSNVPGYDELFLSADKTDLGGSQLGKYLK